MGSPSRRGEAKPLHVVMIDTGNQTPFYVYPLCRALAAAGCRVELLTAPFLYGELPTVEVDGRTMFGRVAELPVLRRYQRPRQLARALEYPLDWSTVLLRLRRARPDVVHVQWAMLPPLDALAFRAIRKLGIRLVYTVHDIRAQFRQWRRTWLSTEPLYQLADALIVHTEANRRELCALSRLPEDRIHTVIQGVEAGWASPSVPKEQARADLGLPGDAPLVLFFGLVKPYKRLEMLIEAMPRILARLPEARLMIVGRPVGSFAPYRNTIDRLGLERRVITRLEYVSEGDKALYLSAADLVALPYTDADFSGAALTALYYGRPVVATETGGLREVISDGENGYVVPSSDVNALADAIVRVLADPAEAARLGEHARARALAKHDWQASARATMRIYHEGRE